MTPPTLVIACAFAVAFCCGGLRAQVTILNPSFELGTQVNSSTGYYSQVIPVSTFSAAVGTLSNWTATASTVNAAAGNFYPTPGGSNWTTKEWDGNSIGYLQVN